MSAIFTLEDYGSSSSKNATSLDEEVWPTLGDAKTVKQPPALTPKSGFWSTAQKPNVTSVTIHGAVPSSGTAKGGLAQLLAGSRPASRASSDAGDLTAERAAETLPRRGRKKKSKNNRNAAAKKGAAVITDELENHDLLRPKFLKPSGSKSSLRDEVTARRTVPNKLRDEEDTWNFVKQQPSSTPASSVCSSPPRSGLSSLLSQAHPAGIATVGGSDVSASSGGGAEPMVTYEVAIGEDYVSKDVDSRTPSRTTSPSRKKMTADDFEPLKCLGKGSYGTVLLVRHKATGRLYAQKQFKKASLIVHKKTVEQTKTERAILESVRHTNVVKLYYAFQDHEKLYLILEYAQGGELFHHLAEECMFCEDTAAFYIAQLVLALSHLHMNVGVIYRDLKPENCLLDADGHLLLTDFGLSKVSSEGSRCRSLLGTPGYMAPEVLSGDGKEYGAEVDWWGVGILAFELLTGNIPFEGSSPEKVKQKIQKKKLALPSYLSADAKDFITRLLRKEPHKRLGYNLATDLPIIKGHRFFRKINWAKLEARELQPPIRPLVTDPLLAENFSNEFTDLPLSPSALKTEFAMFFSGQNDAKTGRSGIGRGTPVEENPFHGFSFVATSLLQSEYLNEERFGTLH